MIHHPRWIRKKVFNMFSNSIDCEIFVQEEIRFERASNIIKRINDYGIKNKHDSTKKIIHAIISK